MWGDVIMHHPGHSTHVNYISRAIRAGRHSTFYMDELQFNYEIMHRSSMLNAEEIVQDKTILAPSRLGQGREVDPVSALQQAGEIFNHTGALRPPANAAFRIVWFPEGDHWYNYQVYIRFEYTVPDPLRDHVAWYWTLLLEDLELSEGRFIETEPTLVKLWER